MLIPQQHLYFFSSRTCWYLKLIFVSNTFWTKILKSSHSVYNNCRLYTKHIKMREVASFDHILKTYVGGHGKYQIINAIYMTLLGFASLPINFYVFTAYAPPHRCHVPKCEAHNGTKVSTSTYLIL